MCRQLLCSASLHTVVKEALSVERAIWYGISCEEGADPRLLELERIQSTAPLRVIYLPNLCSSRYFPIERAFVKQIETAWTELWYSCYDYFIFYYKFYYYSFDDSSDNY
jgi:hypothetical protein